MLTIRGISVLKSNFFNPLSADDEYTRHLRDEIPTHRHRAITQNHFVFVKLLPYERGLNFLSNDTKTKLFRPSDVATEHFKVKRRA